MYMFVCLLPMSFLASPVTVVSTATHALLEVDRSAVRRHPGRVATSCSFTSPISFLLSVATVSFLRVHNFNALLHLLLVLFI
jgi:hypothetical protein